MKIPESPVKAGLLWIGLFAVISIGAYVAVQIAPYVYEDVTSTTATTSAPSNNTTE